MADDTAGPGTSGPASSERLRSALRMALSCFEALVDPDAQKGILTNVKLQGEAQGVDLSSTYDAVVDIAALLRGELGESDEEQRLQLDQRLVSNSVANQMVELNRERDLYRLLVREGHCVHSDFHSDCSGCRERELRRALEALVEVRLYGFHTPVCGLMPAEEPDLWQFARATLERTDV